MTPSIATQLADLPLFAGAGACVVRTIAERAIEVRYTAGEVMFLAGSPARGWYIVLEGKVRVVRGSGARQHVIHTEGPGGTLGEVPVVTKETHPATGIAAEPTRCVLLDRKALEAAIAACPEVAFVVAGRLAHRVRNLVQRLDGRTAFSVRVRLIEHVLARRQASRTATISLGMTQQALAEELGTVREVVSRELRKLVREGLLDSAGGGRYTVTDPRALQRARE